MVVPPRPLALDLDAGLRSAVAVAEVGARDWALIVLALRENGHKDRGLLVGRCVRIAVRVAAGEAIDRLYDRVDRHVELFTLDTIGDDHLHMDDAVGAGQLNVTAGSDTPFCGEFR